MQENNQTIARDDLLTNLKNISFAVFMTVLPSEYCLEIEIMTSEGTSYQWIGYNDWKVFRLEKCAPEKWTKIIRKLGDKTLMEDDLRGTDLDALVKSIDKSTGARLDLSQSLQGLLAIAPSIGDEFYCYCGDSNPMFFASIDELKEELQKVYSYADRLWENMDTEELQSWWERYKEEGESLPVIRFDSEE